MVKICVLCGTEIEGHGHDPAPLNQGHGRCCDECNTDIVIPKRMEDMQYAMFKQNMDEQKKWFRLMLSERVSQSSLNK